MRFYRVLRTAMRALLRNPMRAFLTTLGIIIGILAVIVMMEIGNGTSTQVRKTIESMGANTLLVLPGAAVSSGVSFGGGTAMTLTPDDLDAIVRECPAVNAAAPQVRARVQIVYQGKNWVPNQILGTTPAFLDIRNWTDLTEGASFTNRDVRNASKVCLIGQTIVTNLFGDEDPIGKEMRVGSVSFRVVGVLSKKGANMVGQDQDDILLAPWTTIKYRVTGSSAGNVNQSAASASTSTVNTLSQLYPSTGQSLYPAASATEAADTPILSRFANIDSILVGVPSAEDLDPAISQITSVLHERHRIGQGQDDDFNIRNMTEFTNALTSTTTLVATLLLVVAFFSLVVGGVGIMNIMLVSVTERTREIGLRMAVGARSSDILRQFLTEAVTLCLIGGILGIAFGHLVAYLINYYKHWPIEASPGAIVASVVVSALVGIVFGAYPAWKASHLDPIEALRYE